MSELIDNREQRKEAIKKILADLHAGKSLDEVKQTFAAAFDGVSAMEISAAEQALIAEGLPVAEVQKLCDVHAAVFKGSIADIHRPTAAADDPGHPVWVLKAENRYLERILHDRIRPYISSLPESAAVEALSSALADLAGIDIHYSRKENLLFPLLEKYGVTAPPQVMWGVDDEIRQQLKAVRSSLAAEPGAADLKAELSNLMAKISEMIFKEENILLPMLVEHLTEDEWKLVADESGEIGYLVPAVPAWRPAAGSKTTKTQAAGPGAVQLPSGSMDLEELTGLLNTLPLDITFVDKDDVVRYFSEGSERLFPRARTIIGRQVSNCHPPASVAVVEQIIADLKSGKKQHEDFWLKRGEQYILIRYFAVRSAGGEYLGVLEVTQDIKPLQAISGEKRLLAAD